MSQPRPSASNRATARPTQSHREYIPGRGDVIWIDLNSQSDLDRVGHEQTGRRRAVVLSLYEKNKASGMASICPITTQKKGLYAEVEIKESPGKTTRGVALVDQLTSVSWSQRDIEFCERMPESMLQAIFDKWNDLTGQS